MFADCEIPDHNFVNKLDREGLPPLDVLQDVEESLRVECAPMSWPIGMGKSFRDIQPIS